jgi:N-acetylglucosaminyl-diphospho-decaprenol L-rhamnosyltransferase
MSLVVSIVSHQQGALVLELLKDLQQFCPHPDMEVLVTINCREKITFSEKDFGFKLIISHNKIPKGFGANHNAAFQLRQSDFFAVLNPDLRLTRDPFGPLSIALADKQMGVIAPLIVDEDDSIEDSARRLPTPLRLLRRYKNGGKEARLDYPIGQEILFPDWVAGIFMLFPSPVFYNMNGFDERYYLYFEDVDICSRLRLAGYKVALDPQVAVIHNAQRKSHQQARYLRWHLTSGCRFFSSRIFWACWLNTLPIKVDKDSLP